MEKRMNYTQNISKLTFAFAILSGSFAFSAYGETFSEAFAKARSSGLAEFNFNGNIYSTKTADEQAITTYGPFPITLKGYNGSKINTVSYSGQIARHVLHDSLKKWSSKGNGGENAVQVLSEMMKYFSGSKSNMDIVAPASKDGFPIKQNTLNDISKGKNLSGKTYKGTINAWPNQMTGPEVLEFMIRKAAVTNGGFDPAVGYNYTQLISKFAMGAVFL
jgi:hypothetical protein